MENQTDICSDILYRDYDKRTKKLIVVGQYKPNDGEVGFIKYLKENLKLNFDYDNIDID
ncbi:MAG: hypothetical protein ABI315_06035 [Bacteroidia bacterium]